jgi:lambda family phage portal protein
VAQRIPPVKPTLADRVVAWVNPVAGAHRWRARTFLALTGGYDGGRRDRRSTRSWRPKEASANADIIGDLPDLRARSRDLVRNNPIAGGAIATVVTNVVGDGLTLQSRIDAKVLGMNEEEAAAWQESAEREWEIFCESCDFTRAQSHYELQALALRGVLESGDILAVRRYRKDPGDTYGTKILLIEADRVSNPGRAADSAQLVAGVAFDGNGVATGYQVASRHPDDFLAGNKDALKWSLVPARDDASGRALALLLFDRLRPDQARGVPYLAPVIEVLKQLSNLTDAELKATVVASMFTAFVTSAPQGDATDEIVGASDASTVADPQKEIALEDAGAIVQLDAGQDVKIANPGRPNPIFEAFTDAVYKQVGVALELPKELVVKSFQASYSASRAALEMAWQFFRRRRSWLAWRLCQPTYEWMLEEAVASGRIVAPGFFDDPLRRQAYLGSDWVGPTRIILDPQKEAAADREDLNLGVTTRADIIARRTGGTIEQKTAQLAKENRLRASAGLTDAPAPTQAAPAGSADTTANSDTEDETKP